jgi:cytoskeleton-associated protein 5
MSEEKENGGLDAATYRGKLSPPLSAGLSSGTATGGRGSPTPVREGGVGATGDGIESWKRAAEVTSQLKARIEQMKVSLQFKLFPYHPLWQTALTTF